MVLALDWAIQHAFRVQGVPNTLDHALNRFMATDRLAQAWPPMHAYITVNAKLAPGAIEHAWTMLLQH